MPANGVTLAEQSLLAYNGVTTEKLTFIHQDASGASVQQTRADGTVQNSSGDGRTGEYDALGRNVADAGPFITLTVPPESKGGIDLFGTSAGYRPGGQIYRIDGLVATQSEFSDAINSGGIGGAFGLLEMSARMSAPRYTVRDVWGLEVYSGTDWGQAREQAFQTETLTVYRTFNESWSVMLAIAPQGQTPASASMPTAQSKQPYPNCFTFYDLIYKNEVVKKFMADLWSQTYRAAAELYYDQNIARTDNSSDRPGEFGAVAFFDQSDNEVVIQPYGGYKRTKSGDIAQLPDDYLQQLEKYKQDRKAAGNSERILLIFHTHPPDMGSSGPTGEARSKNVSTDDSLNINLRAYGVGPLFGILITGNGKFQVYGPGKSDDETLKRTCITRR